MTWWSRIKAWWERHRERRLIRSLAPVPYHRRARPRERDED
jgi:hypothetical protein